MGAECEVCGRDKWIPGTWPDMGKLCIQTGNAACNRVGYERLREEAKLHNGKLIQAAGRIANAEHDAAEEKARADAAERERDKWREMEAMQAEETGRATSLALERLDRALAAEATIATLREEVERLRREVALSPPQANPQEPEGSSK